MTLSRRAFLRRALEAAAATAAFSHAAPALAAPKSVLAQAFPDLRRHFIFEYYAWYGLDPIEHWDQYDRRPPADLASNYMPRLGAYDSSSTTVMEQHARWIKETGAGAINVSWWGKDSSVDRLVPTLMDVMRAHDIAVTFHLEPYRDHHALAYAEDIEYLIRTYGEKRRWDTMLLLRNQDGKRGPVFKSFRTILPPAEADCRNRWQDVPDYAADEVWRAQTDRVRATFAREFDHVTLLADSLDVYRTKACGFDGMAIYDNYVTPTEWRADAEAFSAADLLFSFNTNPGFDAIVRRRVERGSCYRPPAVEPDGVRVVSYEKASAGRIEETFAATVTLQTDARLSNARRGFFLVYINSFNEWHEGHQFEPMRNRDDLTRDERRLGYRNPLDGSYRMKVLRRLLDKVLR